MVKRKKVAIFVDWENLRKGVFEEASKKYPTQISFNDPENSLQLIKSFIISDEEEIYRIFFYLAEPFGGRLRGINYSQTPTYQHSMVFIEKLEAQELVAVRRGELVVRGFDQNADPIFVQKKVDMLLGLDIAHVSFNKLADRIMVLCADTDIIPAMKTARINGLQVIFGWCSDIQSEIRKDLKRHSDFIRDRKFQAIFPNALQASAAAIP